MLGLVLSKQPHQEYDQIVNIYTKDKGKKSYLAKGSKKIESKNAYYLEPFSCIDFNTAEAKGFDRVTTVDSVKFFAGIRRDFTKSLVANYVCKLVDKITREGQKDELIFSLFLQWLIFLEGIQSVNSFVIDSFIFQLYSQLGFRPNLSIPKKTGSKIGFSPKRGGFVEFSNSRMSEEIFNCNQKEVKLLKQMLEFNFDSEDYPKNFSKKTALKMHKILFKFIHYQTEQNPTDWKDVLNSNI